MCLSVSFLQGQITDDYKPVQFLDTIPQDVFNSIQTRLKLDKEAVLESKNKVREYVYELYDQRVNYLIDMFNRDLIIRDNSLTPYLQSILNKIYKSNPQLVKRSTVYIIRSEVPNALSFGEGTIAITLGLLSRLETESQIAFVLSHEVAHDESGHSNEQIMNLAQLNYDRDIKKKVKSISRSEYGQFTKFSELAGSLGFSISKHSREKENEADSIALILLTNAGYDNRAPIRTLEILDSAGNGKYQENLDLKRLLSSTHYPFKDSWLEYTKSDRWYASQHEHESDSMKTHPDCKKRIAAMQRLLRGTSRTENKSIDWLNEISDFEIIESHYHFNQYGRSLFLALAALESYPDNVYLHAMVGKCFSQLYAYQKAHELSRVLTLPDPRFPENYDRFLTFVHRLRLMELASIGYNYMRDRVSEYSTDEEFLYACWLSCRNEIGKDSLEGYKNKYATQFPKGKYKEEIQKPF